MVNRPGHEARILVTGASGFVGRHAVRHIRRTMPDATVIRIDRNEDAASDRAQSISLDVTQREDVDAAIAELRPTAVLHLAAVAAPAAAAAAPDHAWDVNVFGTMHLARAVLRHTPDARFLFVGSAEVYGASFNSTGGPVDEETLLRPMHAYATTKAAADLVVGELACRGLRAVRFRPFNHTGPGQEPTYVVPSFASQIARIERGMQDPVIEVGDLEAERDFLDVRDVVRAYVAALTAPAALEPGIVLNIASGRPQRIREILERLIALCDVPVEVRVDPARFKKNDVQRTWGTSERARSVLGWSPEVPFEQTIRDILDDWRERLKA